MSDYRECLNHRLAQKVLRDDEAAVRALLDLGFGSDDEFLVGGQELSDHQFEGRLKKRPDVAYVSLWSLAMRATSMNGLRALAASHLSSPPATWDEADQRWRAQRWGWHEAFQHRDPERLVWLCQHTLDVWRAVPEPWDAQRVCPWIRLPADFCTQAPTLSPFSVGTALAGLAPHDLDPLTALHRLAVLHEVISAGDDAAWAVPVLSAWWQDTSCWDWPVPDVSGLIPDQPHMRHRIACRPLHGAMHHEDYTLALTLVEHGVTPSLPLYAISTTPNDPDEDPVSHPALWLDQPHPEVPLLGLVTRLLVGGVARNNGVPISLFPLLIALLHDPRSTLDQTVPGMTRTDPSSHHHQAPSNFSALTSLWWPRPQSWDEGQGLWFLPPSKEPSVTVGQMLSLYLSLDLIESRSHLGLNFSEGGPNGARLTWRDLPSLLEVLRAALDAKILHGHAEQHLPPLMPRAASARL